MRIGRIMGVFLSMLSVMGVINYSVFTDTKARNNSFGLADASEIISNSTLEKENKVFDIEDNSNIDILTYTNNFNHQVNITSSNIDVTCIGTGDTALTDQEMVENNFKIKASFSENKGSQKYDSMSVEKGKQVYIYVLTEYVGEFYPTNEVNCDYSINIEAA